MDIPTHYELDPSVRITADTDLTLRPPQWLIDQRADRPWWRRWFR